MYVLVTGVAQGLGKHIVESLSKKNFIIIKKLQRNLNQ